MNKVILMGRLTRDPDVRTTQGGKSVAQMTLAVDRRRGADGQQEARGDRSSGAVWLYGHAGRYSVLRQ